MRLLVVEDDKEIKDFLARSLKRERFAVDCAEDGEQGLFLAQTNSYDLIILDNMLPKKNGTEICISLRATGSIVPILMLSVKTEADEKAALLNAGADDYLGKPYSYIELMARIRALLRRPPALQTKILRSGAIELDSASGKVRRNNKIIYVTHKEFGLLELLLKNQGKVVSRGMIMDQVWNADGDPLSRTIEVHILNLRKKIESAEDKLIISVPGRGYTIH